MKSKMPDVNTTKSITTCEWIKQPNQKAETVKLTKRQYPTTGCVEEINLRFKDTCRLKVKRLKKLHHTNSNHKEAGMTILVSEK